MPRLFVAVDFPGAVRERIANICFGIPGARWVPMEQLHLTLRFVGDVDNHAFEEICTSLSMIEADSFSLSLKDVGYFPPRRNPRVVWVGVQDSPPLARLAATVEEALQAAGVEPEKRKFSPHVTVARMKGRADVSCVVPFLQNNSLFSTDSVQISEFHLYSSDLTRDGAIHAVEESYSLGG